MEPVTAAAGRGIVERKLKRIFSEEPAKGAAHLVRPALFSGSAPGFEASGDHGAGLEWLLIEARSLGGSRIEPIRADRVEVAFLRALDVDQPCKGPQASSDHLLTSQAMPGNDER